MEMKTARQVGFFTSILLVVGCGGGGTLSLPGGGYCNTNEDCNTAEGYTCVLTTSYDHKTCQLSVKPTECPSGHDAGELDAGEIPDAGAPDSGGEVIDAGKPDSGLSDSGTPEEDAGLPDDAGNVPDSGEPVVDAGDEPDAGGSEPDAGPVPDAGTELDAGEIPDAGTPTVDAGITPDAGATPDAGGVDAGPVVVPFTIDHAESFNVSDDVVVFRWDTSRPANGELRIAGSIVESETTLKLNHTLVHKFAPGVYNYQVTTSDGGTPLAFIGTFTILEKPDLTAPIVLIGHEPPTETSVVITLKASKALADQALTCGAGTQPLTARPSGTVGVRTISLSGLTPGTSYTCQLVVHDTTPAHNAGTSDLDTFTTKPIAVDTTSAHISVFAFQSAEQQDVVLSWNSNKLMLAPMTGEYWAGSGAHHQISLRPGGMTGTMLIPGTNLLPDTVYSIKVSGVTETGVASEGSGDFRTVPAVPPTFGVVAKESKLTHPSTTMEVNWWSTKTMTTVQVKCGTTQGGPYNLTPTNTATSLPATSGKVSLSGLSPETTYYCRPEGVDVNGNVSSPNLQQGDVVTFTTWHIATGKFVHTFDRSSGATTTFLFWESTDFSTNGPEVLLTVQQEFSSFAVNRNPFEKMHVTTDAPIGGAITQPGQAVRVYWPSGAPFLFNGSPIPPLTTDPNYRGRGVINPTADDRKVVGL